MKENLKWNHIINNKMGFTLVEILAVIAILGLITTIFIPNAIKILDDNNIKIYKIKEKELISAAADYAQYDSNFIAPSEGEEKYITMPQLIAGSYMNKILDTSSGNECAAFVKVTLNEIYGYDYDACIICDEYVTDKYFCNIAIYNNL